MLFDFLPLKRRSSSDSESDFEGFDVNNDHDSHSATLDYSDLDVLSVGISPKYEHRNRAFVRLTQGKNNCRSKGDLSSYAVLAVWG